MSQKINKLTKKLTKMKRKKSHLWTKDEIKTVASLWETSNFEDLCNKLDVKDFQLNYIVGHMRRAGFKLTKKHKKGYLQNLIQEVLLEVKKKK